MTATAAASPDQPPRAVLDYPFETPPPTGEATEVAPGVLWIRMPLPFSLSHINLWAIADGGRWTLVDSGLRSPETAAAWRALRDGALGGRDIERVVVTHMHPDHVGMAGWITRRTGCRLWMTRLEYLTCRVLVADTGRDAPEDGTRFYRRAGWDDDALILDKDGLFADPDRVRRLEHKGQWFQSRGPFTVPRSPQGEPVLIQAGQSGRGRQFAAKWGDLVFVIGFLVFLLTTGKKTA